MRDADPGLRRVILGTLLASFPGPRAPRWALDLVVDGLAGHVLFGFNIADATQLSTLTATLRATRSDVLIGIDEEGGDVTRLGHRDGSPYPGNGALGVIGDVTLTESVYRSIGADLAGVGVNLDLAPSADVNSAADNPIIGTRSFGVDPAAVAAHTAAAVRGLQAAGVAACAKHFPGHGATVADSHIELPVVDVPPAVLRERDLPPFAAAVSAGVQSIMSAHIRVPALTGDAPATFSKRMLIDLLRAELGFEGVIVTDALEMQGAARFAGSTAAGAVPALVAGADLICVGAQVTSDLVEDIVVRVAAAVDAGDLASTRLEEAASRVATMAKWAAAEPRAGRLASAGGVELGLVAARRAVTVEGTLPALTEALVVQFESASTIAEGSVPWGLANHVRIGAGTAPGSGTAPGAEAMGAEAMGAEAMGAEAMARTALGAPTAMRLVAANASIDELRTVAGGRPIVVAGRNLHRLAGAAALIESLASTEAVVVVEMGWPSSWRPALARAFVTTYGASQANGRAAAEALGLA